MSDFKLILDGDTLSQDHQDNLYSTGPGWVLTDWFLRNILSNLFSKICKEKNKVLFLICSCILLFVLITDKLEGFC